MANTVSGDNDYQAQSDMRTLVEADAIRADKKRMAAAQKAAMKRIEDLESAFGEDDEADDKK